MATESESAGIGGRSLRRTVARVRERYPWTFRGLLVQALVAVIGITIGLWYGVPGIVNGTLKHLAVFLAYTAIVWSVVVNVDEVAYFRREYTFTFMFIVLMVAASIEGALATQMGFGEYAGIIYAQQIFLVLYAVIIWGVVIYLKRRLA